jgi:hypothetical protein
LSLAPESTRRGAAGFAAWIAALSSPALFCIPAGMLSVWLQGFEFGTQNNVFHIPIVLRWYDLPQFAGDPFIQSLRNYATPVYPFLSLLADPANIRMIFFGALLLARIVTFFALYQVMRACGLRNPWLVAAVTAAVFVSAIYGETVISRDELLVDFFTHTALAQAITLLGIACLIRGEPVRAALAAGLAFDLNAMVGIWTIAPIGLVCLAGQLSAPRTRAIAVLRAALAFALTAFPVMLWILTLDKFPAPDFDFRAYLADYYPYHFFIGWARWPQRIAFLLQLLSGLTAAALLARNRGNAALALLGFALVFAAGVVVGQISHSRFLLTLHLMRADGMMLWLAVALVMSTAFTAISGPRIVPALAGIAAIAGLIANDWRVTLAGMLLLAMAETTPTMPVRISPARLRPGWAIAAMALLVFACTALRYGNYAAQAAAPLPGAVPSDEQLAGARPRAPQWLQLTQWAQNATAPDALFLVLPKLDFVSAAQRRSWVGWKEGAAVMWAPWIYATWRTRSRDVAALHSADVALAYACAHHIAYVIFDKRPHKMLTGMRGLHRPVFANRWFTAVPAPPCPPP